MLAAAVNISRFILTGDATVNFNAPVICCTAGILANIALRDGAHPAAHSAGMSGSGQSSQLPR